MKQNFEIKFLNCKNSFLFFNESTMKKIKASLKTSSGLLVFKLLIDEKYQKGVFTASPFSQPSLTDWEVGISLIFAKALGLQENVSVTLTSFPTAVTPARSVTVSPATEADFEVLELNSHHIQTHLLDQVQVVAVGQPLIIWPTPHLHLTLIVEYTDPICDAVLLNNNSELHVSPHVYQKTRSNISNANTMPEEPSLVWTGVQKIFRALIGTPIAEPDHVTKNTEVDVSEIIFRVHTLQEENDNPSVIFIHSSQAPNYICAKVENIWPTVTEVKYFHTQIKKSANFIAIEPLSKLPIAYISKSMCEMFKLDTGSKIILKEILTVTPCDNLTLTLEKNCVPPPREIFCQGLFQLAAKYNDMILINKSTKIEFSKSLNALVTFDSDFAILSKNEIETCHMQIEVQENKEQTTDKATQKDIIHEIKLVKSWKPLYDEIIFSIDCNLKKCLRSVMVLRGQAGSGKSSLLNFINQHISASPTWVHWASVDCRLLKGKQLDTLRNYFLKFFQECVRLQPTVAVVENLEVFCPPSSVEQRDSAEASYSLCVQELIWDLASSCCNLHHVALVATTSNNDAFRWPNDITPIEYFNMPDLNVVDKNEILTDLLTKHDIQCDQHIISKVVKFTEGYRIQDLKDLTDRILFTMWKRTGEGDEVVVKKEDIVSALSDFVPYGMRGVKLFSSRAPPADLGEEVEEAEGKWSNVGGLQEVKQNLTELIEWPSKYPHLFENAPLKLQAGVVLYGMPGSGKTLLAAELARSSGANFISVKGPELLSKYIGASEQAVRDIFDKAYAAKPCILFFDEFDSLAPSRGRDTTGVSDRVVNQLLTSLDGVDSPTEAGVWVVAATSRPDLLDKALLRPGRLDTILQCPFPSKEERLDILKILSRKLDLADDLNLAEVAELTSGFSGADLQAVLYSAQLAALEDCIDGLEADESGGDVNIRVTGDHVTRSLSSSQPSLSRAERDRYHKIYSDFEQSRIPGESRKFVPQQRTALA